MDAILTLSLRKLSALIRERKLSPVELTQATLAAIDRDNPKLNAYIATFPERALEEAREAEQAISAGDYRGRLHGIPVSVKDLFYTRGVRTTAGSKIFADFIPESDAAVVESLRNAGAVLIGKTHLHELAYGITSNNPHYGPVRNPWRLSHIPGGSSGGSGAAVAASLCAASLGSDTGGSIRIPASLCGVAGLKPTYGRVSRRGVIPLGMTLDHVGPLARTVWGTAAVLQAIAGHDQHDPHSAAVPVPDFLRDIDAGVRGLTIGLPQEYFFDRVARDVETAVHAAIQTLEGLGARIQKVHLPEGALATKMSALTLLAEAGELYRDDLRSRPQDFSDEVRSRIEEGQTILATDYVHAQHARRRFRAELDAAFQQVSVIVLPTTPAAATPIGQDLVEIKGEKVEVRRAATSLVRAFNFAGVPALSLPCGFDSEGLPIGLQIVGRMFDEATVLRVGQAYESATAWHSKRPGA